VEGISRGGRSLFNRKGQEDGDALGYGQERNERKGGKDWSQVRLRPSARREIIPAEVGRRNSGKKKIARLFR